MVNYFKCYDILRDDVLVSLFYAESISTICGSGSESLQIINIVFKVRFHTLLHCIDFDSLFMSLFLLAFYVI